MLPTLSVAVTTIGLAPLCSGAAKDQATVPTAVPVVPVAVFSQVTPATLVLSAAVPEIVSGDVVVLYVAALVGLVMAIVGGVGSWETVIESKATFPTPSTAVTAIWL